MPDTKGTFAPHTSPEGSVNPGTARQGKWSAGVAEAIPSALAATENVFASVQIASRDHGIFKKSHG